MVTRTKSKMMPLGTRAVERQIEPGDEGRCPGCDTEVKFQAKVKHRKVLANVYEGGVWDRVEVFHAPCYRRLGKPYGPILDSKQFGNRTIVSRA